MISDADLSHQPDTLHHPSSFKPRKPLALLTAFLLSAVVAGAGWYLRGMSMNQSILPSKASPSPQATLMTQTPATMTQPPHPKQRIERHPSPPKFHPPASWQVYKAKYGAGYQYSCPSTWRHPPAIGESEPAVYAPGAAYPDGYFIVEREAGGAAWCESHRKWLLKVNPQMKQEEMTISGYPAFQLEGKSTFDDGYAYDRTSVLVARKETCYFLDITSRNNHAQLVILHQILSTFALTD